MATANDSVNISSLLDYISSQPDIPTPIVTTLWQLLIKNKKVDPDSLLYQSIQKASREEDLLAISIALRSGANPNAYVNIDKVGPGHILLFVHENFLSQVANQDFRKDPLVSSIVILLVASGSKSVLPAFDSQGGAIRKGSDDHYKTQSVSEWFSSCGYSTILPSLFPTGTPSYQSIDQRFRSYLAALLDQPNIIASEDGSTEGDTKLEHALRWHSYIILSSCLERKDNQRRYDGLRIAIENICIPAVRHYIESGKVPNYVEMNAALLMIASLKKYEQLLAPLSGGVDLVGVGIQNLELLISQGGHLDQYQYSTLMSSAPSDAPRIQKRYSEPYWRKVCNTTSNVAYSLGQADNSSGKDTLVFNQNKDVPPDLMQLAYSLNLDPFGDRDQICVSLGKLSKANPEQLKSAAIKRQMLRISSSAATTDDFMTNLAGRGTLLCRNRALFDTSPYEYNDLDLSYYKDSHDVLWCFTSDMFEQLLRDKKNPFTEQSLPPEYLDSLKAQRNTLKRLGYAVSTPNSKPITFSDGLDSLRKADKINNEQSDVITRSFFEAASLNGIPSEDLKEISLSTMTKTFESVGIWEPQLEQLPIEHARITFYRISVQLLKKHPEHVPTFFRSLFAAL